MSMPYGPSSHDQLPELTPIDSVSTLLSNINEIKKYEHSSTDKPLLYYRGLNSVD